MGDHLCSIFQPPPIFHQPLGPRLALDFIEDPSKALFSQPRAQLRQ